MTISIILGLLSMTILATIAYKNESSSNQGHSSLADSSMPDMTVPDSASSFGYKCKWFAVKTDDKDKLVALLGLKNVTACNWQVGLKEAYDKSVFITPPIDGWTLACGWGLPHGDSYKGIEEVKLILQTLSKAFGEAQFFATHRVTEYHCWMKATNGQVERVYSYLGESGENILIEGQATAFEQSLNLANTFSEEAKDEAYFEDDNIAWPDEELLMQVAEHWSINPSTLSKRQDLAPSLGLLGQR